MSKTMKYKQYSPKESLGNVKINETNNVGGVSKKERSNLDLRIFSQIPNAPCMEHVPTFNLE